VRMRLGKNTRRWVGPVTLGLALAALGLFLAPTPRSFAQMKPKEQKKMMRMPGAPAAKNSLYTRMGGYDVIAKVVDSFLHQLGTDPAFKRFGGGRASSSLMFTRQMIVDFVCEQTGGPCIYLGRTMKMAHNGLNISAKEWDSSITKWKTALTQQHVGAEEQKEFIAMIQSLRLMIANNGKDLPKGMMMSPAEP
jgi:hemoglobin